MTSLIAFIQWLEKEWNPNVRFVRTTYFFSLNLVFKWIYLMQRQRSVVTKSVSTPVVSIPPWYYFNMTFDRRIFKVVQYWNDATHGCAARAANQKTIRTSDCVVRGAYQYLRSYVIHFQPLRLKLTGPRAVAAACLATHCNCHSCAHLLESYHSNTNL